MLDESTFEASPFGAGARVIERRQREVKASMPKTSSALVSAAIAAGTLWYASAKREPKDSGGAGDQH